ncbi:MAG: redox-sensing transcriptional repressor Rex [Lachnospiraceae bacterium]|nr:redox-sensing transcriptional repressor Rex [Ruminococcus sp.]MCM1276211.1 redox-sensing transcriptional repressor Rex [Lachnospiraceae bacterium]
MMQDKNISKSVIRRLPRYYRFLGELLREGVEKISSRELSERMRLTASQIRQDLNCFGGFGQQGYGYNVKELRDEIGAILHLDDKRTVILIGAGNLGRAVALHIDFERYGFELIGVFDRDDTLTGESISAQPIRAMDELRAFCSEQCPTMAVLCIPRDGAEDVVKTLTDCGVRAFWNFSHYDIHADYPEAAVENVHLTDSLMTLSYLMEEKQPATES